MFNLQINNIFKILSLKFVVSSDQNLHVHMFSKKKIRKWLEKILQQQFCGLNKCQLRSLCIPFNIKSRFYQQFWSQSYAEGYFSCFLWLQHLKKLHHTLDQRSVMIIFESLLTTFEASIIFWGSWGIRKNRLVPKTEPSYLSLSKSLTHFVTL